MVLNNLQQQYTRMTGYHYQVRKNRKRTKNWCQTSPWKSDAGLLNQTNDTLESDVEVWQHDIPLAFLADALNRLHSEFRKATYVPYRIHVVRGVFWLRRTTTPCAEVVVGVRVVSWTVVLMKVDSLSSPKTSAMVPEEED